jgi:hypothetical protein
MSLHWTRSKVYCERSGDTPDAIDKRLRQGIWVRDVHARQPEGSKELWINEHAVNDWAAGKPNPHLHGRR